MSERTQSNARGARASGLARGYDRLAAKRGRGWGLLPGAALATVLGLWLGLPCAASAHGSTAFYYGAAPPTEMLAVYDQVVVQPSRVSPRAFRGRHAEPIAYMSVGEVAASSAEATELSQDWVVGKNPAWATWVLDPRSAGYRAHFLARFEELWRAGYRRYFLDTLDSYQIAAKSPAERLAMRRGLVTLIRAMVARHSQAKVLLNRGFELLPEVGKSVSGVVAESLFDRWDASRNAYVRVPVADRKWLIARLQEAKEQYALPVVVVDYRPAAERAAARATARKIAGLGFDPWVTNADLTDLGVGKLEALPRRILIVTNSGSAAAASSPPLAMRVLAPVIEHLGYVPVHHDLGRGLPEPGVEAGVVTWLSSMPKDPGYGRWLLGRIAGGVRVAIVGQAGFALDGHTASELGLELLAAASMQPTRVVASDALIGFEAPAPRRPFDGPLVSYRGGGGATHLRLADASGRQGDAIFTTSWGGMAASHMLAVRGVSGRRAWVVNPFEFVRRSLGLAQLPVPDLTTDHGRRVAIFLVRSAGLSWPTRGPGRPRTADVLRSELLDRFHWPHALEAAAGIPTDEVSKRDERLARHLLARRQFSPSAGVVAGTTAFTALASLTQVQAAWQTGNLDAPVPGPIASDATFLGAGGDQAYPYGKVLATLEKTGTPRRLKPIFLDYHAYLASSPGGLMTLQRIYQWVERQRVYPLELSSYRDRVRAFGEQALALHLDGTISFHSGTALRTVRVPKSLGWIDLGRSEGIAVVGQTSREHYVTFLPNSSRRLALTSVPSKTAYITHSNAEVTSLAIEATAGGVSVAFDHPQARPLEVGWAGVGAGSRCQFRSGRRSVSVEADASGFAELRVDHLAQGRARLTCQLRGEGGRR